MSNKEYMHEYRLRPEVRAGNKIRQKLYRDKNPNMQLWSSAKQRAKNSGIAFSIERSDIVIPDVCPIFKIPLFSSSINGPTDNSPTLDRIDPTKGYIKNNVRVISHRANHKKQDNTIEELELFIRYMKGEL